MQLSKRLETILAMAGTGETVADIGTDHGFVPIELVSRGQYKRAIAMDVRKGPLERARAHILEAGLESVITTRLSNGFEKLIPGEAGTVVLAGMGGPLMAELLEKGREAAAAAHRLILSPQSEVGDFHQYLLDNHFLVEDEDWIEDENKFYVVIRVISGEDSPWTEEELMCGRIPMKKRSAGLIAMLQKELRTTDHVLAGLANLSSESACRSRREMEEKKHKILRSLEGMEVSIIQEV